MGINFRNPPSYYFQTFLSGFSFLFLLPPSLQLIADSFQLIFLPYRFYNPLYIYFYAFNSNSKCEECLVSDSFLLKNLGESLSWSWETNWLPKAKILNFYLNKCPFPRYESTKSFQDPVALKICTNVKFSVFQPSKF